MIFVTVGTHEQPFDRLVKKLDVLKMQGAINKSEEVFIQTGYSNYTPIFCKYKKMLSYEEMNYFAKHSRIMITHGGPASIFLAYSNNKIPIVVPRTEMYGEHIDNHQVLFTKRLEMENKIILVDDIKFLDSAIKYYESEVNKLNKIGKFDKKNFVKKFEDTIKELIEF